MLWNTYVIFPHKSVTIFNGKSVILFQFQNKWSRGLYTFYESIFFTVFIFCVNPSATYLINYIVMEQCTRGSHVSKQIMEPNFHCISDLRSFWKMEGHSLVWKVLFQTSKSDLKTDSISESIFFTLFDFSGDMVTDLWWVLCKFHNISKIHFAVPHTIQKMDWMDFPKPLYI